MRADFGELITEIQNADQQTEVPLGTAQWMGWREADARLGFAPDRPSDRIWLGETCEPAHTPLGYADDRHVCLVSGTRGGKGTGLIIPNLCLWPGSCIVIDPKGENATVTARRRGQGSKYAHGMNQEVHILDPFGEVQLDPSLRASFNPLDVINPRGDFAVDDAGRIAGAIIVRENRNDPFFEDAARNLLKGLILHVLAAPGFEGMRNLITVRRLLTQGDWRRVALLREGGETNIPSAFVMLWKDMQRSEAFDGVVAGIGEQMLTMAERTRSGVLETARTNTIFLDGAPMQRLLAKSDFDLAALKTNPKGLTIYLTLPQRYMETHFRWLRLMVSLAVGEMERIKGRPRSGYPTLFMLDEFAGLKRMEVIENAVAQAAGFGVKFFFIVQNMPQLKREYEDSWESFVSNSGLKVLFQIDDHFTRDYVSNLLGEQEVRRASKSGSQSQSDSTSNTFGESSTDTDGTSNTHSTGTSNSLNYQGWRLFTFFSSGRQYGKNASTSTARSKSSSTGMSSSRADSRSYSATDGWSESVHKRPLLNPDEIGRFLSRIDDQNHLAYPGLLLAIMPGQHPLVARRVSYFQSIHFEGLFDPHPDHPSPPTLVELARRRAAAAKAASQIGTSPEYPDVIEQLRKLATPPLARVSQKLKIGDLVRWSVIAIILLSIALYSGFSQISIGNYGSSAATTQSVPTSVFNQGYGDRVVWERWFNGLTEDARDGAAFWAGERSKPNPGSCYEAKGRVDGDFRQGCLAAKQFLTPTDARRKTEPDYRRGWNVLR
jgi:type IV secretory pathway TraG/TraD family ATPase VirD4